MSHSSRCFLGPLLGILLILSSAPGVAGSDTGINVSGAVAPHPRILLTSSVLARLKARAAANDPEWKSLKAEADKYVTYPVAPYARNTNVSNAINYSYQGASWLAAIQPLAVAYQVTGNTAYADKVIEIVKVANATYAAGNLEPIAADGGWPARTAAYGLALAFDWVYNRMDAPTRTATINTLNGWFDWLKVSGYQRDGPAYGNYFGGNILGFGVIGYATAGDNPRSDEIIAYIQSRFDSLVRPAFETGGFAGGYPVESYNYGPNHFLRLYTYTMAVRTATGQDTAGAVGWAKKIARNLLYNLKPNRWQSTDEGGFTGQFTGVMPGNLPLFLSAYLEGTTEGMWMQFYYKNLAYPPLGGTQQTPTAFDKLLYFDASRPSLDYRNTEPTYFRSPGDEHVYVRSDSTDSAVYASFMAGNVIWARDHQNRAAAHVSVQRGTDYLLVNSGQWKGPTGITGTPAVDEPITPSWRLNTLFFNDFGEHMPAERYYVGGQGVWGINTILAYQPDANFLYTKSDNTTAYRNANSGPIDPSAPVQLFHRNFVYLRPNFIVVFDRVIALKDKYIKKLFFHFNPNGIPTVNGTLTQSTVGSSSLFLKTLLPDNPVITVAGDCVGWLNPDGTTTNPTTVTYRAEIADSVVGTKVNFLNVMAVTPAGGSMPATSGVAATGGNMVGTLINDSTTPRVVMFAKDGSPQTQVTYIAAYSSGAIGAHLLVDMAPGTYNVFRDGTEILSGVPASANGVVYFEAAGGSMFTVTTASSLPNVLIKTAGDLQSGPAGSTLPTPLTVQMADGGRNPIPGIPISFAVTGGSATLSAASVNTDAGGLAWVDVTFKTAAGPVAVQASGLGYSVQFSLTALPGPPASLAMVSGNNQSGAIKSALAAPFVVKLADANGNGVDSQTVSFTVTGGGGSMAPSSTTTGVGNGLASATLTLGPTAGPNSNTVDVTALSLPAAKVSFTASATGRPPATVTMVSGNNQTGAVSTTLPLPFVVKVTDVGGNAVSGVTVNWTVAPAGSATVSADGINFAASTQVITDNTGQAGVTVKLGATPGSATITATAGTLTPVSFTATAVSRGAANVALVSGNNQSGIVDQTLAAPLVVRVTDSASNPVSGAAVTFLISTGGGTLSPAQPMNTIGDGTASATLKLPQTAGPITVTASASGVSTSVPFSATAAAAAASQLVVVSGDKQSGTPGKSLLQPFVVQVRDQFANPISGYTVNFAVASGTGTLSAAAPVTDAQGKASTVLTLGVTAGTNTVTATAGSLLGSPVTFTATSSAPTASLIQYVSGNNQSGTPGQVLSPLTVRLLDASSPPNPVPGIGVTFAVQSGDASITTPLTVLSDASGLASATLKLGQTAGNGAVSATAASLPPVTFAFQLTSGPAAQMTALSGSGQADFLNAKLKLPLTVKIVDSFGNGVSGVTVAFAVTAGSGGLSAPSAVTASGGSAATSLTLGNTPGGVTVIATAGTLSPVTFTATAVPAINLAAVSSTNQTGIVGQALPPLVVKLTDGFGAPVPAANVMFQTTAGTLAPAQLVATDPQGQASVTLTLPQTVGPAITVMATVAGVNAPVTFNVTAKAAAPAQFAIISGDNQTGTVGKALPAPFVVWVRDQFGNPVSDFSVSFTLAGGGGALSAPQANTDAQGKALTVLTLGPTAGNNTNTVTASAGSITGSPVTFTASGLAASASQMQIVPGSNNQTGIVGQALPVPLVVVLYDAQSNLVPGLSVSFTVVSGGGSITTPLPIVSDSQGGKASAGFQLGLIPGANTVTASVTGVPPVTFTATAIPGPPAAMTIVSGNGQTQFVNVALALPLVVKVTDAVGNALAGLTVGFAVSSGPATLSAASAVTANDGTAATSLTLSSTPGDVTVTATVAGLTKTFTATAQLRPAAVLTLASSSTQTGGIVGQALAAPLAVSVTDSLGAPVSGVKVTFQSSDVTLVPTQTVTSDSKGLAAASLTLPQKAGPITVTATVAGLNTSVVFNLTAGPAAPAKFSVFSGDNQSGTIAKLLPAPFVAAVRDQFDNPVSGFPVTFAVATGDGLLSATQMNTDAQGTASTLLTLGPAVGSNTVTASAGSLAGSPVTFTATGVAASAAKIQIVSPNNQAGTVGQVLPPLEVALSDALGNPVAGLSVSFTVVSGGGSIVAPMQTISDSQGKAFVTLQLGLIPGVNSVTASVTGISPVTFSAMAIPGPPAKMTIVSGNGQTQLANLALPAPLVVRVTDAVGNRLAGVTVAFTVTTGSGTLQPVTTMTDSNGAALTSVTLGATPGPVTVSAAAGGLSVQFSVVASAQAPLTPAQIQYLSGDSQSGKVDTDLQPLQVRVIDASLKPAPKIDVTFQVTDGNGTLSPQPSFTDSQGVASASFRLGTRAGANRVVAILDKVAGSPIVFNLTGQPGPPIAIETVSGNNQVGGANSALPQPLVVRVKDAFGNGVPGVSVTISVTQGDAVASPKSAVTDQVGLASVTVKAGATTGPLQVQMSVTGLSQTATFSATVVNSSTTQLKIVSGDNQTAPLGTDLPQLLVVQVTDKGTGKPLSNIQVSFSAEIGKATVQTPIAVTDANGKAWTSVTLGKFAGPVVISASLVTARETVPFNNITATAGPPASIVVIGGNNQAGIVGQVLPQAIQVQVVDKFGNPTSATVIFEADPTQGVFSPPRAATDAQGIARTSLTLGPQASGSLQLIARVAENTVLTAPINVNSQRIPFIAGVVNPASYWDPNPSNPQLASNSMFSIFGTDLADTAAQAMSLPLPTSLGGTAVEVAGLPAALLYVSPRQINAISPAGLGNLQSPNVIIIVRRGNARSAGTFYRLVRSTPGLFTADGTGFGSVAARHSDYSPVSPWQPAKRGEAVAIYATGLGPVNINLQSGQEAPYDPLALTLSTPIVTIGGVSVPVLFSGLAPRFASLFQVNVLIADNVPTGFAVPMVLQIDGQSSLPVTIAIAEP